jgi:hypothetical protein
MKTSAAEIERRLQEARAARRTANIKTARSVFEMAKDASDATVMAVCNRYIQASGSYKKPVAGDSAIIAEFADMA